MTGLWRTSTMRISMHYKLSRYILLGRYRFTSFKGRVFWNPIFYFIRSSERRVSSVISLLHYLNISSLNFISLRSWHEVSIIKKQFIISAVIPILTLKFFVYYLYELFWWIDRVIFTKNILERAIVVSVYSS